MMIDEDLIKEIKPQKKISKDDLFNIIQTKYTIKKTKTYDILHEMIELGYIHKHTYNTYSLEDKNTYHYDLSTYATKIDNTLKKYYVPYIIYESNILNEWLNHLLNNNYIIVEVDNLFLNLVFDYLKEKGFKNILLNPDSNELDKYKDNNSIIIISYPKYAPKKDEHILIEKLIIDLFSNKILNSFYERDELQQIYTQIFDSYNIDFKKVFSYAKRKKIYEKFINYLKENNLEVEV